MFFFLIEVFNCFDILDLIFLFLIFSRVFQPVRLLGDRLDFFCASLPISASSPRISYYFYVCRL